MPNTNYIKRPLSRQKIYKFINIIANLADF